MGQPVVHFEVIGKDPDRLKSYYSELFGWSTEPAMPGSENPYGVVAREQNLNSEGIGIAGGIGGGMDGYDGHATFYVEVPDVEAALARAESLGGARMMGPHEVPTDPPFEIGLLTDPEGHTIGVVQAMS